MLNTETGEVTSEPAEVADELRLYLVIRKDVGDVMSKPKFGAQCGHATLDCWIACLRRDPDRAWAYWNPRTEPKIVLEVKDEAALLDLQQKAIADGFCNALIREAGRTELAPGTITALAIGPVWYLTEAQTGFIRRLRLYKE